MKTVYCLMKIFHIVLYLYKKKKKATYLAMLYRMNGSNTVQSYCSHPSKIDYVPIG